MVYRERSVCKWRPKDESVDLKGDRKILPTRAMHKLLRIECSSNFHSSEKTMSLDRGDPMSLHRERP